MRVGRATWIAVAAIGLTAAQQRPAPPVPPQGSDDTVVTGQRDEAGIDLSGPVPKLRGGLWEFHRTATMMTGTPSNVPRERFVGADDPAGSPRQFRTCLDDDDLAGALRRMAGERSNLPDLMHCGRLQLSVKDGRISGRRICTLSSFTIGRSHSGLSMDIGGAYDARTLRMNMAGEEETDGLTEGTTSVPRPANWRWRVTASRVGACPQDRKGLRRAEDVADLIFTPVVGGA